MTSTSSRGFWCGRGAANFFQNESKDGGIYGAAHHELVTNTPKVDGVIFPECSTFFFIMKLAWMAFTTSLWHNHAFLWEHNELKGKRTNPNPVSPTTY